jgi:hypothetical protein
METSVVIMQHGENLVSQAIRALPRAAPGTRASCSADNPPPSEPRISGGPR